MTQIPVRDANDDPEPQAPAPDQPTGAAPATGAAADEQPTTDAGEAVPANQPVPDQEADNPDASHNPDEAGGRAAAEIEVPEQPLDGSAAAELRIDQGAPNPVAEATGSESKDPYSEGKHIANPEPNNGQGLRDEDLDPTER